MTSVTETGFLGSSEQQVRQRVDAYIDAFKRKDLEGIMACYTEDVVAFDVPGGPLSVSGKAAYRQNWEHGFSMMTGDLDYELRDLTIAASGNVAFAHALSRLRMTSDDGQGMDSWMRVTWCLREVGGAWLIAHEHGSFPVDMATNKALTELQP